MAFRGNLHADIATASFSIRVLPPQVGRSTTPEPRVILGVKKQRWLVAQQPWKQAASPHACACDWSSGPDSLSLLPMEEVGCGSPLLRSKRRSCVSDQRHLTGFLAAMPPSPPTASRLPCGEMAWSGFVLHRRSQNPAGNQWRPNQERLTSTCRAEGCLAAAPGQLKRRHRPACPRSRQSSDWQSGGRRRPMHDAPLTMADQFLPSRRLSLKKAARPAKLARWTFRFGFKEASVASRLRAVGILVMRCKICGHGGLVNGRHATTHHRRGGQLLSLIRLESSVANAQNLQQQSAIPQLG